MMHWIVEWSLKFRLLVVALAVATFSAGIIQLRSMPVDALPEFAPPYVEVQTEAPGLSAPEVEELVTLNLEELMNGTPWLQSIRSTSVPGLSSITLIFQPGTDIIRARQLVSERLSLAYALPNASKPPVILQPMSAMNRVMVVGMTSKQITPIEMSTLAYWNIRPALLSVPGVANVAIWGLRDQQLQVLIDPQRLKAHNVTVDQIVSTTGNALWVSPLTFLNASTPGSGGWIDTPQQRIEVRHVLPISSPNDLAQVNVEGTKLRLGDVATVVEDHQPLIGDDIIDNNPGLMFVIEKFPGANTLDVTRGIEAKLNELRPGLSGIQINSSVFRPASFVEMATANPSIALLVGFLLVALIFLAALYSWRAALISLISIPLSLTAAGLVLSLRGATINMMVLAGIVTAVGIVVDDAIIDVENIMRRLRQYRSEGSDRSTASIILEASLETRSSMVYATLIILLALLPVFLLQGISGSFFQPMVITYALALLASMVVALIVTPALCLLLLNKAPREQRESPILRRLQRGYDAILQRFIRLLSPAILATTVITAGVLASVGLAVLPSLGAVPLLPSFREPDIVVQWEGPPGTSYPEMARITTLASRELRTIPGVSNVAADIGRAVLGDQVVDVNSAQLLVSINPTANYDATVSSIQKVVNGYPGIFHIVQTYLQDRTRQVLTGSSGDIVVRIYGVDLTVLRNKAEEVRQALSQIPGTADVHPELQVDQPQVDVEVNLAKAQQYGLKPGDVRRAAAVYVAGIEAGSLFQDQKVFTVVVWGTPETRSNLNSIRDLLIDTPNGGHVRLGDVATVSIAPTPNFIQHDTVSRRIDVSLNVRGRDPSAVVSDIKQRLQGIKFPLEYRAQVLGEYTGRQADQQTLLVIGLAAAIGIFLLLQAVLGSWRLASVLFFTLPSALLGGVLAAFAASSISLVALIGLFAIFGIAVRNSILQINHYQHLERYEGEQFGPGLVLRGARERFAPILITALAAGLALVPLAVSGNTPGLEVERPMAIIIIGGLVTATLFNLFIVPALYSGFATAYVRPKVDEPVLSPMLPGEMTRTPHNGDAAVSSHNGDAPNPSHNGDSAVSSHNGNAHISSHNGDSAVSSHNDDSSVSS